MKLKRISAIVRPHRLEEVKTAVADVGVSGMSVSDVRGAGNSPELPIFFGNQEIQVPLPVKSKLVVVVPEDKVEEIVQAIILAAATGEPGDGKIFVEPVLDALRIRTGERGEVAV